MSLAVTEKFSLIGVIFQRRCNHEGSCMEKEQSELEVEGEVGGTGGFQNCLNISWKASS